MRIGFAKREITPPVGTLLSGYAGHRPCSGVHDPLWCKAVLLEQEGRLYGLLVLDLMCVDEALCGRIARAVAPLGIEEGALIVCAIHSHAAPCGIIAGEGPLGTINGDGAPKDAAFGDYLQMVIQGAVEACREAKERLEPFRMRMAQGQTPAVGSERHTGDAGSGDMTAAHIRTESGREVILYNFPCHPTVLSAENLQVSADFVAGIEEKLGVDMALFVNGAAGDISTRFTRRASSFSECERMAGIAARQVLALLEDKAFEEPAPLKGHCARVTLQARRVETEEAAEQALQQATARWQQAADAGADATQLRLLRSYVEGAGVNLEFARTMQGIDRLHLPVTVFRFGGMDFASVPGELFSSLQPEAVAVIGYANGYYRYLAPKQAYEDGWYEAMAAILAPGEGERLVSEMKKLLGQLEEM